MPWPLGDSKESFSNILIKSFDQFEVLQGRVNNI